MSDNLVKVLFKCPMCGKEHSLDNISETEVKRFENRRFTGDSVQGIFKDLSASDREKFLTGYCDDCQKKIFGEWYDYSILC